MDYQVLCNYIPNDLLLNLYSQSSTHQDHFSRPCSKSSTTTTTQYPRLVAAAVTDRHLCASPSMTSSSMRQTSGWGRSLVRTSTCHTTKSSTGDIHISQPWASQRLPANHDADSDVRIDRHVLAAPPMETRYIRILARNAGDLPSWHLGFGTGNRAWLFVDEVEVRRRFCHNDHSGSDDSR